MAGTGCTQVEEEPEGAEQLAEGVGSVVEAAVSASAGYRSHNSRTKLIVPVWDAEVVLPEGLSAIVGCTRRTAGPVLQ